jgi:nicotinamidase-related amidase
MPKTAALLMDLQRDFLDCERGRLPVDRVGAEAVIRAANGILAGRVLAGAVPVFVATEFPRQARLANFVRRGAAVAGSAGAMLDPRLEAVWTARCFVKATPSAFTNPELEKYLRAEGVTELHVLGVFAEGCVRATVVHAIRLGFTVVVHADAVASDRRWKKRLALWAMRRAGATMAALLAEPPPRAPG